jgi:hypothetical protein
VSDSNGSVGGDQFVETVNTRYQVWSLDRTTMAATSVLGPSAINTLWAGFGGLCEEDCGDPVVIFDKTARRWLFSKLTEGDFLCVASRRRRMRRVRTPDMRSPGRGGSLATIRKSALGRLPPTS